MFGDRSPVNLSLHMVLNADDGRQGLAVPAFARFITHSRKEIMVHSLASVIGRGRTPCYVDHPILGLQYDFYN